MEERVVLVKAIDHKLISKFRMLWQAQGSCYDPLTEDFLKRCVRHDSAITEETGVEISALEAVEEIEVQWLLNRWYGHEAETRDWCQN